MKQKIVFLFFFLGVYSVVAQTPKPTKQKTLTKPLTKSRNTDSLKPISKNLKNTSATKEKDKKANIQDYLIISYKKDTTFVDTTLTIQKEYKYNYLRKDNFGRIPFANVGQTYNNLTYTNKYTNLMPLFGARARHYNYMEIEDINYYQVPTPFTELYYKSAFKQGQQLDAFFAVNLKPELNFSIAYKGLRSLGNYQHAITSTGNFRFTTSIGTPKNRYKAHAHIVMQDLSNEENGGIKKDNLVYFETGDKEFIDRGVLEMKFEDATNILKGKRFHIDHSFELIQPKDSLQKNKLSLQNVLSLKDKFYQYKQNEATTEYFGDAIKSTKLSNKVKLENFYSALQLNYFNTTLGELAIRLANNNYNYGYDKIVLLGGNTITNRLKGDVTSLGATYQKRIHKFTVTLDFDSNISGAFKGNRLYLLAAYKINNDAIIETTYNNLNKAPNYNFQLFQNQYINYNWQNQFKNQKSNSVTIALHSKKILNVKAALTHLKNYTYFKQAITDSLPKPEQFLESISYFKIQVQKDFKFLKKFGLENTILYQSTNNAENVLHLPKLITRNTLYFETHFFKKALFLQTGVTFNYFSSYYMNGYDPVLAEFYVQNRQKIGAYPRFDFFINSKIRQTRIYLKAEHFNAAWTGRDYYAAPDYPYRDFKIRFGLVWNFFL